MPAIEWERLRRRSPSVQVFADDLRAEIGKLPAEERAESYRDTLQSISPSLEKRVSDEAQLWMDRGYAPDRALRAATYGSLVGRRRAIFHGIFTTFTEEQADKVMQALGSRANPTATKEGLDQLFEQLRPDPLVTHPKPHGRERLKEAGFQEDFIAWAVSRKPLGADDIRDEMVANMNAGMNGREAMRRAIVLAIREYTLDYMMATGVAYGTDFCVVGAVVSAAVSVVVAAAGAVVQGVRSARASRDQRTQNARFEAQYYMEPMSDVEVDAKVQVFYARGLTKAQAGQALVDYMRTVRQGRPTLLNPEVRAFDDAWRRQVLEASEAIAAAKSAENLPKKIVAYGVPVLGAIVLVVGLSHRKRA
jgi:hypothetical protein